MGLRGIIWDVDSLDWEYAATNPAKVLSDISAGLAYMGASGIIQLQHDIVNQSITLLPQVRLVGSGDSWDCCTTLSISVAIPLDETRSLNCTLPLANAPPVCAIL